MKSLVIGLGSIGKRHLENLLEVFPKSHVRGLDINAEIVKKVCTQVGIKGYINIEDALCWSPELVYVCAPTHLHVHVIKDFINTGASLFVEKPVANTVDSVFPLINLLDKKKVLFWAACNLRYHEPVRIIKSLVDEGRLGKLISIRFHFGHYLPNWRPDRDYKKTYSAMEKMGGGDYPG